MQKFETSGEWKSFLLYLSDRENFSCMSTLVRLVILVIQWNRLHACLRMGDKHKNIKSNILVYMHIKFFLLRLAEMHTGFYNEFWRLKSLRFWNSPVHSPDQHIVRRFCSNKVPDNEQQVCT